MKTFCIFETGRDEVLGYQKGKGSYVKVRLNDGRLVDGEVHFDADRGDDELYIFQAASYILAHYSKAEIIERNLRKEAPIIEDGEIIDVHIIDAYDLENPKLKRMDNYKVKVLGDYSDCALLIRQGKEN